MATTQHQNGAAGIGSILPSLIDQVQDALIFLDRNYTVVDYSEGAERISGWSRDEVLGKNFTSDFEWDFAATEDGRRVWADLWAATPTRARARVRRKDAAWLELDIALTPVAEGAEQPAGWLLIARDMTAEATLTRKLAEREAELAAYFRSPAFGMVVLDDADRFARVNESFCRELGYEESELLGRSFLDITHPDDQHLQDAVMRELWGGSREAFSLDKRYVKKDGTSFWAHISVSLLKSSNGKRLGRIAVIHNIEPRKLAEAQLKEERDFRALVMETMTDGLTVTDEHCVFEYVNPAFARMVGRDVAQIVGRTPASFAVPSARAELAAQRNRRTQGESSTYEFQLERVDGTPVDVLVSSTPRESNGTFAGAIAVVKDITARRRAERALEAAHASNETLVAELKDALQQVRTLSGFLPICSYCKRIRDDVGYWEQIEAYVSSHTGARFSHGICPECEARHFPGLADEE